MKNNGKILLAFGALAAWALIRKHKTAAVGKVERVKRRIYKEVSLAQEAGVDFSKKYADLATFEREALERVGKDVGWKQSKRAIESGKPYVESYYGSLRRAWNAVSGVMGIGRAYDVKDADGNVCLTWIDAEDHVQNEPDAHVLLALPPHVEQKVKREPKSEDNYARRFQFAQFVWQEYRKQNPYFDDNIPNSAPQWVRDYKHKHAVVADAYALNRMRVKNTRNNGKVVEVQLLDEADWMRAGSYDDNMVQYAQAILDAENNKNTEEGFAREDLNDIRRALLDKAQHMHVDVPYDLRDKYEDLIEDNYIRGNNRYDALELINWIFWVHQKYELGGDTYYPMYSFATKEDALQQSGGKMSGRGFKIIPVWDVPIEKITGIF